VTTKSRRHTHPFTPSDLPPDVNGQGVCGTCNVLGRPGVGVHSLPTVPAQAEHVRRYEPDGGN
jgi:hypothetical protein